jgi:hypothetical protein
MAKPPRRTPAIPILLLLVALVAGAGYSVMHALRKPAPDATPSPQSPAIIFLPAPNFIYGSPTEPTSCASTTTPTPTPIAPQPKPTFAKKLPPLPAPTHHPATPPTAAPTLDKLPPPPAAASEIPLTPMKVVPIHPKS